MTVLIVATGNPGKLQELQEHLVGLLAHSNWKLQLKPPELDVEETGTTFQENARLKASQVAQATGCWAIADDSGLMVDTLQGAPGVYSARYGTSDRHRIDRLLSELEQEADRGAQFVCALALADPSGTIVLEAEGICRGEIVREATGKEGFGYDPIFYVPEVGLTFAEMSPEQKQQMSHRGQAFAQLNPQLSLLFQNSD